MTTKHPGKPRTLTEGSLRRILAAKKIRIIELAAILKCSREDISRYINRGVVPDIETATRFASILSRDSNPEVRAEAASIVDNRNTDEDKRIERTRKNQLARAEAMRVSAVTGEGAKGASQPDAPPYDLFRSAWTQAKTDDAHADFIKL